METITYVRFQFTKRFINSSSFPEENGQICCAITINCFWKKDCGLQILSDGCGFFWKMCPRMPSKIGSLFANKGGGGREDAQGGLELVEYRQGCLARVIYLGVMPAAAQSWRTISHLHWLGYRERVSICPCGSLHCMYFPKLKFYCKLLLLRGDNSALIQHLTHYTYNKIYKSLKHKSCLLRLRVLQWLSLSSLEADGWRYLLPHNWDLWHRAHAVHHLQY